MVCPALAVPVKENIKVAEPTELIVRLVAPLKFQPTVLFAVVASLKVRINRLASGYTVASSNSGGMTSRLVELEGLSHPPSPMAIATPMAKVQRALPPKNLWSLFIITSLKCPARDFFRYLLYFFCQGPVFLSKPMKAL
jgi:hypothetical protein